MQAMFQSTSRYLSAGGNRHPSAADWDPVTGLVAFGAGQNIALWDPLVSSGPSPRHQGIQTLLHGHSDTVTAISFFVPQGCQKSVLASGSADGTLRLWNMDGIGQCSSSSEESRHDTSIHTLVCHSARSWVITGSADATVKLWKVTGSPDDIKAKLIHTIVTRPKYFPLALAIHDIGHSGEVFLAVAGTRCTVECFAISAGGEADHVASLAGHEGWIRSLAITREHPGPQADLLLASASQDKYIRLWRIESRQRNAKITDDGLVGIFENSLSNKRYIVSRPHEIYLLTFEALLLGHEDWIYSLKWRLPEQDAPLQLLSASADNSLAIWEVEGGSGIWICSARFGEISLQKGSTTATGSTGGFWNCLWSIDGTAIASLVGTGSWRLWRKSGPRRSWSQVPGVSGHTKAVTGLGWTDCGKYLLSTSRDQTTRLHAEWKRSNLLTWHEFGRPQIHGYDLNCIASTHQSQFVSGADEKLLRVFDQPRENANLLEDLCQIAVTHNRPLPETAGIPVLGLSNKVAEEDGSSPKMIFEGQDQTPRTGPSLGLDKKGQNCPPTEDQLARFTLWPEREKLYGHGHEMSALAVNHCGSLVPTSCKASALEHAVIRIYDTADWREIKPPLAIHSLTVTALAFSPRDDFLLSVGRDRQWALFQKSEQALHQYELRTSDPKGHTRMILDACWAPPVVGNVFATAGRDKAFKIWHVGQDQVDCEVTVAMGGPVTALAIAPTLDHGCIVIAAGTEQGVVSVYQINLTVGMIKQDSMLRSRSRQHASITQLRWRPCADTNQGDPWEGELAIGSHEGSTEVVVVRRR